MSCLLGRLQLLNMTHKCLGMSTKESYCAESPGLVFTINYREIWEADSLKGDLNFIITVLSLRFQDIFLDVLLHAIVARYGIEE